MKRMHVMLRVEDLDAAIAFYTALLDAEPAIRRDDYAKWMVDDPQLNFSVARKADGLGIEHLGLQAGSPEELEELRGRIARAGGTVHNEEETTCCYANSDKTWVVDQQGVAWEAFYTHGESETYFGDTESTCCFGPAE
jgi:catechol 2,3-dioxygenase-like lactoylglutathione lyase family enzyme